MTVSLPTPTQREALQAFVDDPRADIPFGTIKALRRRAWIRSRPGGLGTGFAVTRAGAAALYAASVAA